MEYLIALDLEGVHGVMGEPLSVSPYAIGVGTGQYEVAKASAVQEVNRAVKALFDGGATRVLVWDNHGARDNIDFSLVDPRAEKLIVDTQKPRLEFLKDYAIQGIVFLGYHSKAGAINGNLAHTYNGMEIDPKDIYCTDNTVYTFRSFDRDEIRTTIEDAFSRLAP